MKRRCRKRVRSFLALCWAILLSEQGAAADPLDEWHWRNPLPTGNPILAIAANDESYVAVGELGTILTSPDGKNWLTSRTPGRAMLRGVAWGEGVWVAVGDFGEVLTSPDGSQWSRQPNPWFYDLNAVAWGNGLFVAVGDQGSILSSSDGSTWTLVATGTHPLRAVVWGNGRFVAGGGPAPRTVISSSGYTSTLPGGPPWILSSLNGTEWQAALPQVEGQVTCLAFGAGRFVAGTSSCRLVHSFDGLEWTPGWEPGDLSNAEVRAVAYFDDRFVASYGGRNWIMNNFVASPDGTQWDKEPWDVDNGQTAVNAVALGGGSKGLVAATAGFSYSMEYRLLFSTDGRSWQASGLSVPSLMADSLAYAGDRFFILERPSSYDEGRRETWYLVSRDAQHWESCPVSDEWSFGVPAFGNLRWIAGGQNGLVVRSADAVNWEVAETGQTNQLSSAAFVRGSFYLSTDDGDLLASVEGTSWRRIEVGADRPLGAVIDGHDRLAVAESNGTGVYASLDGETWVRHSVAGEALTIRDLQFWEEGFIAVGWPDPCNGCEPELWESTDLETWRKVAHPAQAVHAVAVGEGRLAVFPVYRSQTFYCRGAGETTWTSHVPPWQTSYQRSYFAAPADAVFAQNTLVLTHGVGFILQSEPLTTSTPRLTRQPRGFAVSPEAPVTLRANATGSAPLRYQWSQDGLPLPDGDQPFLTVPASEITGSSISVTVENDLGTVASEPATLVVPVSAVVEITADASQVWVRGTEGATYRVQYASELGPEPIWINAGLVPIPSFGGPGRLRLEDAYVYPVPQSWFYRAVFGP